MKELANTYYKKDKKKNGLLILAIALAVFLLYGTFSISDGKIRADYLIDLREVGTSATISLEKGSQEQYEQMKKSTDLSDIGIKKTIGQGTTSQGWGGNLVYLDQTAFEKLMKPAYTDIVGSYPKKENEIMLPIRVLTQMKIDNPKIGEPIDMNIEVGKSEKEQKKFYLSGYYKDYIKSSTDLDEGYLSETFIKEKNISLFPVDKILASHDTLKNDDVLFQQKLDKMITKEYDAQRLEIENPMFMQSIKKSFGSFYIIIASGILVIMCSWLLVFNVVSISLGQDIRQYGLLKILGATNKQLRNIIYRQKLKSICIGISMGGVAGIIFVKIFLPKISSILFMEGIGLSDVKGFYPVYLILSCVFIFITAFLSTSTALRRVMKWEAIDSIRYVDVDSMHKKTVKIANNLTLSSIAWRNVTRSKKRLFISVLSIALGGVAAMCATVITTGTDKTNELRLRADFTAIYTWGPSAHGQYIPKKINDNTNFLPKNVLTELLAVDGVKKEETQVIKGSFAIVDYSKDKALAPKKKAIENFPDSDMIKDGRGFSTLQIVNQNYISKLEMYAQKNKLPVDIESLKNGTSVVLLQRGEFSTKLNEETNKLIGSPIHFYSLEAFKQPDISLYEKGILTSAGALDVTDEFFPALEKQSMYVPESLFILTDKAFEKLNFPEKHFGVAMNVEGQKQAAANQLFSQILQKENKKSGKLFANSDVPDKDIPENFDVITFAGRMKEAKTKIKAANLMMGLVCLIILLIGIMNFINTMITGFITRKKEFAIMESLGLTKRQLRKMLFIESFYYWLIITGVLVTVGTASVYIVSIIIKNKLVYFEFNYPWLVLLVILLVQFIVCLTISSVMSLRNSKQDVADQLRLLNF